MDALVIGVGKGSSNTEVCLPAASLEVEGSTPEVGDVVDFSAAGKVSRVEGGHIYVSLEKVNGEPLPKAEQKEVAPESEEENLRKMAKQKDEEEGVY